MKTIPVGLGERAYEVHIGSGLLAGAPARIRALLSGRRAAVVADQAVISAYAGPLAEALGAPLLAIPSGEASKRFDVLVDLSDRLLALDLDRRAMVIAVGGGVTGDLAGFAAAIYKRGIDFIQVPTTLLAQVDSSVGGKTGIDTPRGKNLIGAFHQPRLVIADLDTLSTLPDRDLRAGYAEVIKCGLLGDAAFFDWLESDGDRVLDRQTAALEKAVSRCVEMKAAIVAADEYETSGARALLNLGHTFGHAFEAETGFSEALSHGEAVAAGCALAFRLSARLGHCPAEAPARVQAVLRRAGLPSALADLPGSLSADRLLAHMAADKKAEAGELVLVLARGIGDAFVARGVAPAEVREFLLSEGALP